MAPAADRHAGDRSEDQQHAGAHGVHGSRGPRRRPLARASVPARGAHTGMLLALARPLRAVPRVLLGPLRICENVATRTTHHRGCSQGAAARRHLLRRPRPHDLGPHRVRLPDPRVQALDKPEYAALNGLWIFVFVVAPGFLPPARAGSGPGGRRPRGTGHRRRTGRQEGRVRGLDPHRGPDRGHAAVAAFTPLVDRLFHGRRGAARLLRRSHSSPTRCSTSRAARCRATGASVRTASSSPPRACSGSCP